MIESEEATIIRRCQAGDTDAFRELVKIYRSLLFGTAYLMTQDRGLAEDVVQEALAKIWKHMPSLHLHSSFRAWLVRIVVNEVKQSRRKRRLPTVPLEYASEIANDCDHIETIIIQKEERQHLKRALERLSVEHRETVILRYFSDLTVPEIAKVTRSREGTIKSRLSRALEHLREILRSDEIWTGRG